MALFRLRNRQVTDPAALQNFEQIEAELDDLKVVTGAFSAYLSGVATVVDGGRATYNAVEFNYGGWYDTAQSRFTPQVAGIYRLSWAARPSGLLTSDVYWAAVLRKNGADFRYGMFGFQRSITAVMSAGTALVIADGVDDYFDVSVRHSQGGAPGLQNTSLTNYFDGELVGRT